MSGHSCFRNHFSRRPECSVEVLARALTSVFGIIPVAIYFCGYEVINYDINHELKFFKFRTLHKSD